MTTTEKMNYALNKVEEYNVDAETKEKAKTIIKNRYKIYMKPWELVAGGCIMAAEWNDEMDI